MSHLKEILVELQNCVHDDEQYSGDVPVVWSREFQVKLAQNADHWNKIQKQESHVRNMDFQDDEQIRIPYDEEEENDVYKGVFKVNDYDDEEEPMNDFDKFERNRERGEEVDEFMSGRNRGECTYGDAYREYTDGHEEEEVPTGEYEVCDKCHGKGCSKCEQGLKDVTGRYKRPDFDEEEEETKAKSGFSPRGMRSDNADDCEACYGTGMDFPRLKGDCQTCGGSGKVKEEQAEEELKDMPQQQEQPQGRNENPDEQDPENVEVDDQYGLDDPNDDEDFGEEEGTQEEWDDPNYQGVIRTVPSAHLVYKRQLGDGTFDELWQYNLGDDFKRELKVRRAILAGTDIPINKMRSPDNSQTYELWTVGNGQLLKVNGLPN